MKCMFICMKDVRTETIWLRFLVCVELEFDLKRKLNVGNQMDWNINQLGNLHRMWFVRNVSLDDSFFCMDDFMDFIVWMGIYCEKLDAVFRVLSDIKLIYYQINFLDSSISKNGNHSPFPTTQTTPKPNQTRIYLLSMTAKIIWLIVFCCFRVKKWRNIFQQTWTSAFLRDFSMQTFRRTACVLIKKQQTVQVN